MNLNYISSEAWEKVRTLYPSAYHILIKSSLDYEKVATKNELTFKHLDPRRRKWLEARLKDLTHFDEPEHNDEHS